MNKRQMKKGLAIVLALVMVFAMSTSAFAANTGYISVSVTQNNFNTNGAYTGDGSAVTVQEKTITDYEVSLSDISTAIAAGLKTSTYLPSGVTDPMNGQSSVLDAIVLALQQKGISNIQTGWSSYEPAGGYISNFGNYTLVPNTVTYFNKGGKKWGRSTGTGWNIAYTDEDGEMVAAASYASNVELTDGMDIIIDVSAYDMTWNTGEDWTE